MLYTFSVVKEAFSILSLCVCIAVCVYLCVQVVWTGCTGSPMLWYSLYGGQGGQSQLESQRGYDGNHPAS